MVKHARPRFETGSLLEDLKGGIMLGTLLGSIGTGLGDITSGLSTGLGSLLSTVVGLL